MPLDSPSARAKWGGTWWQSKGWNWMTLCDFACCPTCSALRLNGSWPTNKPQRPHGVSILSRQITPTPFHRYITFLLLATLLPIQVINRFTSITRNQPDSPQWTLLSDDLIARYKSLIIKRPLDISHTYWERDFLNRYRESCLILGVKSKSGISKAFVCMLV